jgi:hypothetical protein
MIKIIEPFPCWLVEVSKVEGIRNMGRPSGSLKTGGRKKGTPNKSSAFLLDALLQHGIDPITELAGLLPKLELEKRADILVSLMSYFYPKRKAIEISGVETGSTAQVILVLPKNGSEAPPEA